ncbi:MAG: DUF1232 domain-containing protein [Armatimonadetes bacterium]|nr:DUF1232 domain-containing protein [Armatimonadota bacterium]
MQNTPALRRTPWGAVLSVLFALVYGASPIDLIPDVIPLIGWLDDGVVLILCIVLAAVSLHRRNKAIRRSTVLETR